MKRTIRKTSFGISITYKNGNFSNNLHGENASVLFENNVIHFALDLTCNLRVRNKEFNCFYDINELAEDHLLLEALQINDDGILKSLAMEQQKHPDASWLLQIDIAEKGSFKYSTLASESSGSLLFTIQEDV